MQDVFVNLFTDFGFKKLFGEEPNKALLISFLNTLLPAKHQIANLTYTQSEHLGPSVADRKAIFDLSCVSDSGERFIVELQKAKQNFFKDRSLYYATFPIQEQANRGDWDFRLEAVYTIGILDFVFDEDRGDGQVVHEIQLKDQHNQVFYDKLTFIYLTLPHFTKSIEQLETLQDKWLYTFRHLHTLTERPEHLSEEVFEHAFQQAQIARFDPNERQAYESSLKYYRDLKNVTDTARGEGFEEGREEGLIEGARRAERKLMHRMQAQGLSLEQIAQLTDQALDVVRELLRDQ